MLEVTTRTVGGFAVEARTGGASLRMDEPREQGGQGTGLTPQETLLAALSGCTSMTLLMYAQRKQWPLTNVLVRTTLERPAPGVPGDPALVQTLTLEGALSDEQRQRLLEIADRCPVSQTLKASAEVATSLAAP